MIRRGVIILLFAVLASCSGNRTVRNPQDLYGTRMTLPETAGWVIQGRDTTVVLNDRASIVVYYNEKGCTPCRMTELYSWKEILKEASDEKNPINADFVFIFKSDPGNEEFRRSLVSMDFRYPVLCDPAGEFETNNTIPRNVMYHVFLLDRNNEVALSGSPIFNPRMWELYKSRIALL